MGRDCHMIPDSRFHSGFYTLLPVQLIGTTAIRLAMYYVVVMHPLPFILQALLKGAWYNNRPGFLLSNNAYPTT